MKLKSIALPEMVGKTLQEVNDYLKKTYTLPTADVIGEICRGDTDIPKDENYYFNFGLLGRDSDGCWDVSCAFWDGSLWSRNASSLDDVWDSDFLALILDDITTESTLPSELIINGVTYVRK